MSGALDTDARGRVSEVLATLTVYARSVANVRTTIFDALWYPCVVLLFALVLFGAVVAFLVPQYDEIFRGFGMQLPAVTEALLNVGREPFRFLVLPVLVVIVLILGTRFVLSRSEAGRRRWASWIYAIPIVGTLLRAARLAAFAVTVGGLTTVATCTAAPLLPPLLVTTAVKLPFEG